MTGNIKSRHQQASEKGDEQTMDSDIDVSMYSTKTSNWCVLQISFHGRKN